MWRNVATLLVQQNHQQLGMTYPHSNSAEDDDSNPLERQSFDFL
jgi:hypothetical protein